VEHLRLERYQLLEKLEFMKDKGGQRPYPRPSYSNKDVPRDMSSENSISVNRSREQSSARRKEYISSYTPRLTKSASNDIPLGIPRLLSNLGIPRQDVDMEDGDKTRKSPGPSTTNPLVLR
jgi:hypothetical protein